MAGDVADELHRPRFMEIEPGTARLRRRGAELVRSVSDQSRKKSFLVSPDRTVTVWAFENRLSVG